jgi:hypothetical protein
MPGVLLKAQPTEAAVHRAAFSSWQACAALAPGGVLAVNCVTRSEAAFAGAVAALKGAFPQASA